MLLGTDLCLVGLLMLLGTVYYDFLSSRDSSTRRRFYPALSSLDDVIKRARPAVGLLSHLSDEARDYFLSVKMTSARRWAACQYRLLAELFVFAKYFQHF